MHPGAPLTEMLYHHARNGLDGRVVDHDLHPYQVEGGHRDTFSLI